MKHYNNWVSFVVAAALTLGACSDDDTDFGTSGVIFESSTTSNTLTSASLSYSFNQRDDVRFLSAGFCYGPNVNPTIYDSTIESGIKDGKITATLNGLTPFTTYHARAFICIYGGETIYSDDIVILTSDNTAEGMRLAAYQGPTYADDYRFMSAWEKRNRWNLSNVHDPSVILAEDGYYYMYQTDASYGNTHTAGGHFHGRRSKDLVNWEYLGGTMKNLPDWVVPKLNEIRKDMGLNEYVQPAETDFGYWAPSVNKVRNGLYRMYYSIVVPGLIDGENSWGERAFIGMMENTNPANNDGWIDKGYVITNASDKGLDFHVKPNDWSNCYYKWNAIDPSYIITPEGKHWLIYGSWHSGIAALELNAETGKPQQELGLPWAEGSAPANYGQTIATRQAGNRWQASEGPEIIYNPETEYYYLFLAYDELSEAYNTRVARAKNITGPYLGIDGKNTTEGAEVLPVVTHPYKFNENDGWVGISHCAVFDDGQGNWYYSSQGRFPKSIDNNIMLGHVRSILWTEDGWPLVMPERYGAVPQVKIQEEELIGDWQHIDLSYKPGEQKTPITMTLAADHTITAGTWKGGKWNFDAEKQVLTANGVKLYLKRETDWESTSRTHTIVYAGYGGNFKTYWGKKNK